MLLSVHLGVSAPAISVARATSPCLSDCKHGLVARATIFRRKLLDLGVALQSRYFFASPLNTSSIVVVKVPKGLASILGCWMEPLIVILKSSWRAPCQIS